MLPTRNAMSATPENILVEEEADYHAVVRLDHDEARVIYFSGDVFDPQCARPEHCSCLLRRRVDNSLWNPIAAEWEFFLEVATTCQDARAVILVGPSAAKTEFVKYLHRYSPEIFDRVVGIETMARLTDNRLITERRRFFDRADCSQLALQ